MSAKEIAIAEKDDPTVHDQFTIGIYNKDKSRVEFDIHEILQLIAELGYGRQS